MRWFNPEKLARGRVLDRMLRKGFRLLPPVPARPPVTPREMKKIVVFEHYYLGDLVMTTPALRALRKRFPDAEIDLVAPSSAKGMKSHFPWIDRIIPFRCPWTSDRLPFPTMALDTFRLLKRLRSSRYDMAIEMRGDLRNIMLAYLSGAKRRVSFGITGGEYLLTDVVPYDDEFLKHQLEGNLEVVRFLGCDISENFPELAVDPDTERSVVAFLEKHPKPVIGIHPGASRKNRLWDVGNWARLVDCIIENLHATVIVLHGPSDEECELAGNIRGLVSSKHRCVPYCETISHLISMIHHLDLLVALDSFSSHIASSVGTPFVALFGPQNPRLTRPYHFNGSLAIVEDMACRPCGARCIFGDDNRCMKELSLDRVWHHVTKTLQRQGSKGIMA